MWNAVHLKPSILKYWFQIKIVPQEQDPNYAISYNLSSNLKYLTGVKSD